jgi:hypothetical protein
MTVRLLKSGSLKVRDSGRHIMQYYIAQCPFLMDMYLTINSAGLVTFMICIQKLSGLKLGQDILTEVFRVFFMVLLVPPDICRVSTLKLGRDRVVPFPFQIISNNLPIIRRCRVLATERVVK